MQKDNADNIVRFGSSVPGSKKGGNGDSHDGGAGGLEKRVRAVERKLDILTQDIAGIKNDISAVKNGFGELKISLARIDGRLAAMPTTWQLIGLISAVMGGAFAVIRFGMAH